jgi:hypothetical protein
MGEIKIKIKNRSQKLPPEKVKMPPFEIPGVTLTSARGKLWAL